MIVFPDKFYVGFQKRQLGYKTNDKGGYYHIAYLVTDPKLTSWNNWKDSKIPTMEIINTPRTEYRIFGSTQRSRDWYGSGRNMVYIEHPDGFVFEISVENLVGIHAHMDTIEGEFKGELILSKSGKNLILVPKNSSDYDEVFKNTMMKKTKALSSKTINPGTKFLTKTNETYIYLGKHLAGVSSYAKDIHKKCIKSMYYVRNSGGTVSVLSSLNAFEIIKENEITDADCLRFAKNYREYATEESIIKYTTKQGSTSYMSKIIKEDTKEIQYNGKYVYSNNYYNDIQRKELKKEGYESVEIHVQMVTGDKIIKL